MRLAQEVSELDSRVKKATVRLENGEIPDEEMHAEWERHIQTERQRMEAHLEKAVNGYYSPSPSFYLLCMFHVPRWTLRSSQEFFLEAQ